jgi:hypothetical protein
MLIRSSRAGVISAPRWFPFSSNASRTPFNNKSTEKNFYSIAPRRTDERTRAEGGGVESLAARARGRDARTCARAPQSEDDPRRALASVHERSLAIHRPPRLRRPPPGGRFLGCRWARRWRWRRVPRGNLGLVSHAAECRMVLTLPSRRLTVRPCRRTRSRSGVTRGRCVSSSGNFQGSRTLKFHEGGGNTQISQTIEARVTNDTRKEQDRTRRRRARHSDRTRHDRVRSQPIDG